MIDLMEVTVISLTGALLLTLGSIIHPRQRQGDVSWLKRVNR